AAWQNFYVMMGSANAALTGLVFVALSIHLRAVLEHPRLKPRAVIALTVLATQIVIAAIVLAPQSTTLMGVELFALNASFLVTELVQRRAIDISRSSLISFAIRLVYIYAAINLFLGIGGGIYVLACMVVVALRGTRGSRCALPRALYQH